MGSDVHYKISKILPDSEIEKVTRAIEKSVQNGLSDDFKWFFKILGNFGVFHSYAVS